MMARPVFRATFVFLLAAALAAAAAPAGFTPAGEWTVGPAGCDLLPFTLPEEGFDEADFLSKPGSRIGSEGDLLEPVGGKLVLAGAPPVTRSLRLPDGYAPQDVRRGPTGTLWLLACTSAESFLLPLPAGDGPLAPAPAEFTRVAEFPCLRILAVTATRVALLASSGAALVSVSVTALSPGAFVESATREIAAYGAAYDPERHRIVTLRANGGAVNTIVEFGVDLIPEATRLFFAGETCSVGLEAVLPGRRLLLTTDDAHGDEPLRSRVLLVDPLDRVAELGSFLHHPLLPRTGWMLGRFHLYEFVPASPSIEETGGRIVRHALDPAILAAAFRTPDDPAAVKPRFADPAPAPPLMTGVPKFPPRACPLSPRSDGSAEVYFTDPLAFCVYRVPAAGGEAETLPDLADVVPGGPGELYFIAEGRSRAHKCLQEYDDEGNYMRTLREIDSADPAERHAGIRVAGKDAAGRVHLVYTERGAFRHETIDYRTGALVRARTIKVDLEGLLPADDPWSVSPDGKLRLAVLRAGEPDLLVFD